MNKKILAFGASNSRKSINKIFASYVANSLENIDVEFLDLNEFEMPLFSIDRQLESGIPGLAHQFRKHIEECDAIIISFAEHNGAYTVAFKNIFDWVSRIDNNVWMNRPMLLLSTSPGGRGGKSVLETATDKFQRMNGASIPSFSLPKFKENFSETDGILDKQMAEKFQEQVHVFVDNVFDSVK